MKKPKTRTPEPPVMVDLFCGIGGMTHGFAKEGFEVVAGIDVDPSCRYAYEANNPAPFFEIDVEEMSGDDLRALYPDRAIRILAGCAPCQPFSLYTNRDTPDEQWKLLRTFADLVVALEPDVVSMENVPRLVRYDVFDEFVRTIEDADYIVTHTIARGPEYGIPQRRNRLVLFASKYGTVDLLPPTHGKDRMRTVRDAVGDLPPIAAGESDPNDPLHRARGLTERNLTRLRHTPSGGGWDDWTTDLRLKCHKRKAGRTFRSVYGRMSWDEPAPVVTTQFIGLGNGRFGHPEQDRAISLREAAIFQTFPKYYRFWPPKDKISLKATARHIGNALPIRLARIIARSIKRHLREHDVL